MPIGVSYTGFDGKTERFSARNGSEVVNHALPSLRGSLKSVRDTAPTGFTPADATKGLDPRGSVKEGFNGIALDGDSTAEDGDVYSKRGGRKGWHSRDELDPKEDGGVIGDPTSVSPIEQDDTRPRESRTPFRTPFVSRIVFESTPVKDEEDRVMGSKTAVWQFVRETSSTGGGRTFAVSKERKNFIGFIDSVDDGPFAIRDGSMVNCYYMVEQNLRLMDDVELTNALKGELVWLQITYSSSGADDATVEHGDMDDYNDAVADPSNSCVPLYLFTEDLSVAVDFRKVPQIQQWMSYVSQGGGS